MLSFSLDGEIFENHIYMNTYIYIRCRSYDWIFVVRHVVRVSIIFPRNPNFRVQVKYWLAFKGDLTTLK